MFFYNARQRRRIVPSLIATARSGITVFPKLERMTINRDFPGEALKGKMTVPFLDAAVAAVSRPKSFCWYAPYRLKDLEQGYLPGSGLVFAPLEDTSANEQPPNHVPLTARWLPEMVCQHRALAWSTPLVCYGVTNRDGVFGQHTLLERLNILFSILKNSHPELFNPEFAATLSPEELQLRRKTTWEFYQYASDFNDDFEDQLEEVRKVIGDAPELDLDDDDDVGWELVSEKTKVIFEKYFLPKKLKSRVTLVGVDEGGEDCDACLREMPLNDF
ncbi:hypothetical protein IAT40_001901 [Kwoniella sp. CBS 6097]